MVGNKNYITILHGFPEDEFFDGKANFYDKLPHVKNLYYFYTQNKNYKFKYIKKTERIKIFNSLINYVKQFRRNDIDVLFFYSMVGRNLLLASIAKSNMKIVWWAWGYDIYNGKFGAPPLINIDLYKPLTKEFLDNNNLGIVNKLKGVCYAWIRKKAIERVDYFMPTIFADYNLIKTQCPFFKAKCFPNGILPGSFSFCYKKSPGDILVGNSLTYSNNHLDIFQKLYDITLDNERKFVIPINYGDAFGGADKLIELTSFSYDTNVLWLKDFLDKKTYLSLFNKISHAIFGVMRQQAMGNIYYCLRTGVKVYLYKDSVVANQLRNEGYIFFSIEDIDEESLSETLSENDAKHNFEIFMKRYEHRRPEDVIKKLEEITKKSLL